MILVLFSFLAGIVTILSPCILPILPLVLTGSLGGHKRPIGVVVGFILSFSFFTLFLSTLVNLTGISPDAVRIFSVVIIAFFGLSMLLPMFQMIAEGLFSRLAALVSRTNSPKSGFMGGLLLGVSLGVVWTPCVGPILASVIALAATSSVTGGSIAITIAYALGTALPMVAITYGGRHLLQKMPLLTHNLTKIQKGFGVIMIFVAILIFFNLDRLFQIKILEIFPQYGAGLTKIEDNSLVKSALDQDRRSPSSSIPKYQKAPELIQGGEWFNTGPLYLSQLKGKVVLIDFWTYTCINCIRTFPYLRDWYEKYKSVGFVIIGVHSPEFEFEKSGVNLANAIKDFKLTYPIMQDNNFATWKAYNNRYWPAHYLVDKDGYIRYVHFGEGEYDKTEETIQNLLKETGANVTGQIENPEYAIDSLTPETYLGYARIDNFAQTTTLEEDKKATYSLKQNLPLNYFSFGGIWTISKEMAKPEKGSVLEFHFKSKNVFLVLTNTNAPGKIKVMLDGKEVGPANSGKDVSSGIVEVDTNRLYELIRLQKSEEHILRLEFLNGNSSLYAFTFG